MIFKNLARKYAEMAVEELLVGFLYQECQRRRLRLGQVTRLLDNRACWHLWAEDGSGVYEVELRNMARVYDGSKVDTPGKQELEADLVLRYFPLTAGANA